MTSLPPFANEPVLELRRAPVRAGLADALAAVDARGPVEAPVLIGRGSRAGDAIVSTDPGAPDRVVARAAAATPDEVDEALSLARPWRVPAVERAAVLVRAAGLLRERRLEIAALEVRECAKPWPEADGDVCEAIDFLEYYARGALELEAGAPLLQVPGERNTLQYVARGVVAVISPWTFPRRSRCCRARATSARRWCATRACTPSPSPAPPPSGSRSSRRRRRSCPGSVTSSG
jgi:RHH-type proline utilization regulon transcriptional repressor/proline dehydrogenase/delta 1-pyrroline-5-carboxylate dehydrogenase